MYGATMVPDDIQIGFDQITGMSEREEPIEEVIEDFWLRLDNAAKMYPAILSREFTTVFRISAELKEPVRIKPFFKAVHRVEERFPYYKMKLKRGFFWYYLEHHNIPVHVQHDNQGLCRGFGKDNDQGLLFRILVRDETISVEFSHILTDGHGAMEFFKTLLVTYFSELGLTVPDDLTYFQPQARIDRDELEDSFHRYFKKDLPKRIHLRKAFHLPYTIRRTSGLSVLKATLSMESIKKQAGVYAVSITEYLVSIYLYSLQQVFRELDEPRKRKSHRLLRIQVPVNLRNIFPSRSMRNFTLFVLPEIDLRLGYYSFREILKKVHHLMQLEKDQKLISRTISRNVGSERDKILRSLPLFVKSMILQTQYYHLGANLYSGELTNLGKVDLSPGLNDRIESFTFVPPPPNKALKVDCGVIGFKDKLVMTFGNITQTKAFEQRFLHTLSQQGLLYQMETIQEEAL